MKEKRKGGGLLAIEIIENCFWLIWLYFVTVPTSLIMSNAFIAGLYDTMIIFVIPATLVGLPCGIIGMIQAVKYKKEMGWIRIPVFISSLINALIGTIIVVIVAIMFVMAPNA